MKIIAGLGNPEKKYEDSRHNVGFKMIDELASRLDIRLEQHKFHALYGMGSLNGEKLILMKPLTYMNNSGIAIREISDFYRIAAEDCYIVYDDISLELGSIRIRLKGSAGGHNGIKSIIAHLGTVNFPRIKIGVGEKPKNMDLAVYVLSNFKKDEQEPISIAIENSAKAMMSIIEEGIEKAMNLYN